MDEMDYVIFYNKTNTTSNGNSTVRPLRPSRLGDCRWAGTGINYPYKTVYIPVLYTKRYYIIKCMKDTYWSLKTVACCYPYIFRGWKGWTNSLRHATYCNDNCYSYWLRYVILFELRFHGIKKFSYDSCCCISSGQQHLEIIIRRKRNLLYSNFSK